MNQLQIYKRIMILSIVAVISVATASFILPGFCFAQDANVNSDVNGEVAENGAGDSIKSFWESRALPCLIKAGDWLSNLWQSLIKPKVNNSADWVYNAWTKEVKPFAQDTIDKTKDFLGIGKKIMEEKKTDLGVEIEKEEQEIKQESPYLYRAIERYKRFKEYLWGTNSTSTQETNENSE